MFAFFVEASHSRGLGHLFRSLRFASFLKRQGNQIIFIISEYQPAINYLEDNEFTYEIIPALQNLESWIINKITKNGIKIWINDCLDTNENDARSITSQHVKLITFDDQGSGAVFSDLNITAMLFDKSVNPQGKKILNGFKYIILNEEIDQYRRIRTDVKKVVISLGGTDTYGVTVKVANLLKNSTKEITIVTGPGFQHRNELLEVMPDNFTLKQNVPSLIKEFSENDLAITGGGITSFEACASGLPCIVVANETFEIPVGLAIENAGMGLFAGHYKNINKDLFNLDINNVEKMSNRGMELLDINGSQRIYKELEKL